MNNRISKTDRIALALADFVIRNPWKVLFVMVVLVLALATGIRDLAFATNYRVFFGKQNPELMEFSHFQQTYTKNDNILFVLHPREEKVFSPRVTEAMETLTAKAWKIPFAIRVDSVSNFQHSWADGDDLTVEDLIRDGIHLSQEELDKKQTIAIQEPLLKGNLISEDIGTTGVNVTLQLPTKNLDEVPRAMEFARTLGKEIESKYPELKVVITGISAMNNAFFESTMKDSQTLYPIMFLVLVLVTFIITRTIAGTFATVMVISLSTIVALGFTGFVGIQLTPISNTAPIIILTLAIADSIHILVSMMKLVHAGRDKLSALRESYKINFIAVTITSLTTIIGFLALNFSDSPPFNDMGNITAIGILSAWVLSLTVLPAVMTILPIRARPRSGSKNFLERNFEWLSIFVAEKSRPILLLGIGLTILLTTAIPFIDLNDEWTKYFSRRMEFRQDTDFALENLGGLYPIEFSVKAKGPGGISEPEYLKNLEAFTDWLRDQSEVTHVYSYTDVIKRLNKNMHGDDPDWYRIPEDRELAAQYLLLYELSLPYGLDLNDRISIDKSATRITATLGDVSTVYVRKFIQDSKIWFQSNTPEYMWPKPTGATVMFSYISYRNIMNMLRGNAVAIVLIAFVMMVTLKNVRLGGLSIIPNAIPIIFTFGLWSILVGQIGMSSATVSATALGIIVDDTVHFLVKYLRAKREEGLTGSRAVNYAFQTVGPAILANTVILVLGFAILAGSTFKITSDMGIMTAMAIGLALVMDLLFLPALLLFREKNTGNGVKHETAPAI